MPDRRRFLGLTACSLATRRPGAAAGHRTGACATAAGAAGHGRSRCGAAQLQREPAGSVPRSARGGGRRHGPGPPLPVRAPARAGGGVRRAEPVARRPGRRLLRLRRGAGFGGAGVHLEAGGTGHRRSHLRIAGADGRCPRRAGGARTAAGRRRPRRGGDGGRGQGVGRRPGLRVQPEQPHRLDHPARADRLAAGPQAGRQRATGRRGLHPLQRRAGHAGPGPSRRRRGRAAHLLQDLRHGRPAPGPGGGPAGPAATAGAVRRQQPAGAERGGRHRQPAPPAAPGRAQGREHPPARGDRGLAGGARPCLPAQPGQLLHGRRKATVVRSARRWPGTRYSSAAAGRRCRGTCGSRSGPQRRWRASARRSPW